MFSYDADSGEIFLYDEIGPPWWGLIDAAAVLEALKAIGKKTAHVRLNTPGGSVDEGIAIYNLLVEHKAGVITYVDSLAASMGSYIFQAGSERIISENAMVMIHDPWTIALGNATELRKAADVTEKYGQRMVPAYAKRSGKTDEEIIAVMTEESWYTGKEAVEAGFADRIADGNEIEPVTSGLHRIAMKIPESLKGRGVDRKVGSLSVHQSFPNRIAGRKEASRMSVAQARIYASKALA